MRRGELAAARAAGAKKHLQVLSTVSSVALEDVAQARGEAPWYQLYPTDQWPVTRGLIRRARAAGCPALVLTVDLQGRLQPPHSRARQAPRCARLPVLPRPRAEDVRRLRAPQTDVPRPRCLEGSLPGAARSRLGLRQATARRLVGPAPDQGPGDARGRRTGAGTWGGRHRGVEPRWARRGQRTRCHRQSGRGGRGRAGSRSGPGRQRLPPWQRHLQGTGARSHRGRDRAALHLGAGPRSGRPAWSGSWTCCDANCGSRWARPARARWPRSRPSS
jgi:hypothetical protein